MASHQSEPETISSDELTEILAEATGTTPDEIEAGADEIEAEDPSEAEIVSSE